ncbi:MAG: acyl-CoA dehydrogenase family protein [bacterium]|nr:acyl-CoA dehydrogenase family protein [bacterium]
MDFRLTDEQRMLQQEARDFATREIMPHREQLRKKEFPRDIFAKMVEAGFAGAIIPQEYGGAGLDNISYAMLTMELCRADAGIGLSIGASQSLVAKPLVLFGNNEQKNRWLPQIASGEVIAAYAQTEPGAGSDVGAIRTRGTCTENGDVVITGEKQFITNGSIANLILVLLRTDDSHPRNDLTMVLVGADKARAEGTLTITKDFNKTGLHCSPTSSLYFENCRVPGSNIIGNIGQGFFIAMATLTASRPMIAAQSVGVAKAAFEEAMKYTLERKQFGKRIADFQMTQSKLARMALLIEAAELLTYQAAWVIDNAEEFSPDTVMAKASKAKLFASEAAEEIATVAAKLHGGMGFMAETPISWILADSRVLTTYEGTSDIQELIIAREFLRPYGVKL